MNVARRLLRRLRRPEPERPYECLRCDTPLDVEYYTCPNCGSFAIDRRWSST